MKVVVFLFFIFCYVLNVDIIIVDDTKEKTVDKGPNKNPGIKVSFTQTTINYMLTQTTPFLLEQVETAQIPDIHESVHIDVIGNVDLDLTSFTLNSVSIGNPTIKVIDGNQLQFSDSGVCFSLSANWHYKETSFLHLSDSGTLDLTCGISTTMDFGAVINSKYTSGIQIVSNGMTLDFTQFDLTLHGGASWLYNFLIGAFKGDLEDAISDAITGQVPDILVTQTQDALDSVEFDFDVLDNVYFSFLPEEINMDTTHQYITVGVDGDFYSDQYTYSGTAQTMPDVLSYTPMISLFLSDYSVNSAGYVFDKEGLLEYVLTQSDLPPSVPILNTEFFKYILPNLYTLFPNETMQIDFTADPNKIPDISFKKEEEGMRISVDVDTVFQVIEKNNTIVDAFTISLELSLSGNVSVSINNGSYVIIGTVEYQSFNMSVTQSIIGTIDVKVLDKLFQFLIEDILVPVIDKGLSTGIPLPPIPFFTLVDTSVNYFDGYIELQSNFTFIPPTV